jgi:hypothetical protein
MSAYILRSKNKTNLYAAKGASKWAFAVRANDSADKALKTFLDKNLKPGTNVIGLVTEGHGAYFRGTILSTPKENHTTDEYWEGTYQYEIDVDWQYIKESKNPIPTNVVKQIVGDLNKGGHYPMEISDQEFSQLLSI